MEHEETTVFVTTGVVIHGARVIKPSIGRRLRLVEETDPANDQFHKPELLDKGIPARR